MNSRSYEVLFVLASKVPTLAGFGKSGLHAEASAGNSSSQDVWEKPYLLPQPRSGM